MWNYTPEETTRAVVGDYRCAVADAWEAVSKSSGKNMIVVTVKINGTNVKVNHYFVEGEYFNRNITSFFDSFGIKRGDFNLLGSGFYHLNNPKSSLHGKEKFLKDRRYQTL